MTDARKIRLIMSLRNAGISDIEVLNAMETVPREFFMAPEQDQDAYEDLTLPIGCGQTISQPLIVAMMTEALKLDKGCKVLEIGTGSGYQAAILSKLCRRVYSIERHKPLLQVAEKRFYDLQYTNITAICADGMKGWPDQAPFDRIIITACAREAPPDALLDQLTEGGILVTPVETWRGEQELKQYTKQGVGADGHPILAVKTLCPVRFVPLLPDVAQA